MRPTRRLTSWRSDRMQSSRLELFLRGGGPRRETPPCILTTRCLEIHQKTRQKRTHLQLRPSFSWDSKQRREDFRRRKQAWVLKFKMRCTTSASTSDSRTNISRRAHKGSFDGRREKPRSRYEGLKAVHPLKRLTNTEYGSHMFQFTNGRKRKKRLLHPAAEPPELIRLTAHTHVESIITTHRSFLHPDDTNRFFPHTSNVKKTQASNTF